MSQNMKACKEHLERFFRNYPDPMAQKLAMKILRIVDVCDVPLTGKPEGWAAGIIYALATRGRQACGVPGLLNAEFEEFFHVSMSTVRKRAAHVLRAIEI